MQKIIEKVKKLIELYKQSALGGDKMPEDNNPNLQLGSMENFTYFTLPMALNYQRNSYKLWESALMSWKDKETCAIFLPKDVVEMDVDVLKEKLVKYKVALQPNKQTEIWKKLCNTIVSKLQGDIRNIFIWNDFDVVKIKNYVLNNKKDFPYISGTKILNYWLYVISQYTNVTFVNMEHVSVAPDTHVLQASVKLGVINNEDLNKNNIREIVSERWRQVLNGTGIKPIDIHTPLWLWSRSGFKIDI